VTYEDVINRSKAIRGVKDVAIITENGVFVAGTVGKEAEKRIVLAASSALYKTAQRISNTLNGGRTDWILMRDSVGYILAKPLDGKILILTAGGFANVDALIKELSSTF